MFLRKRPVPHLLLALALVFGVSGSATAAADHARKPTVVLVHGAFADASGWNDVARSLRRKGYPVLAPANPLHGVDADSAYLRSVLATVTGPIVLVGHSYGGFVLTNAATGNPNVKALVYVAAFAPDAGDSVGGLAAKFPGSQLSPAALDFRPYPGGVDGYIKLPLFREVFAADVSPSTAAAMAAGQRPADVGTLDQPSGVPAWKSIPSWTLVAKDDQVIPAATQRFMAQRAGARTVEVKASHVAMISKPASTTDLILDAAKETS
ncbi:alpha/beta hydrolase [Kribbella sp. ALI-6-A]|uniref:alpha/beta fold hydrolase n=1 Tax=Kribbella sp. ALI-6-A TaxID=1933817 RepID=UPI00097BFA2D|nr:alpha/beta hydrolase [Kribbella sp. ALI-6-A]ONI73994.1 alpha/beta hydrolase [Kribbella sp. ALI-6-A]